MSPARSGFRTTGPWCTAPTRSAAEEGPPREACRYRWSYEFLLERFGERSHLSHPNSPKKRRLVDASGYHSPASVHKDEPQSGARGSFRSWWLPWKERERLLNN